MRIRREEGEISVLAVISVLLRWRRAILVLAVTGGAFGLAAGLFATKVYKASARFLPQVSETMPSGIALVASQLGIRVPTVSSGWGSAVYVELLRSRALLEPVAMDTVVVLEGGGRRAALMDLLGVQGGDSALRLDRAVRALSRIVRSSENKSVGAVEVSVTTRWPSVSLALADSLVQGVNQFNVATRKSQAAAERRFVEVQASEAEHALREAEDRLQTFLQRNRVMTSPQLDFEHDRLQRDVMLRQQVYTSLVQAREEARIREVRDTPVITVLEAPRLPVAAESRNVVLKAALGVFAGAVVAAFVAFLSHGFSGARLAPSGDAREFFELVDQATPRFLKRRRR